MHNWSNFFELPLHIEVLRSKELKLISRILLCVKVFVFHLPSGGACHNYKVSSDMYAALSISLQESSCGHAVQKLIKH